MSYLNLHIDHSVITTVTDRATVRLTTFYYYLSHIFYINSLLGLGNMADYSHVQRVDDLRVRWHHAVLQHRLHVDIKEPCGELADSVPLPVHEQAAAVGVDERTDSLQDLKDHFFHVDVLLHVFDQVIHNLAFFNLDRVIKYNLEKH